MLNKIKELWKKFIATKFVKALVKICKFLKSWGAQVINYLVLLLAYIVLPEDTPGVLVGLWLFILLAYYLFWKIFKAGELFDKEE
jgi:hypothetical protein